MFSPTAILRAYKIDDPPEEQISLQNWNLIGGLPDLEHLQLEGSNSRLILSAPKTLKQLTVDFFDLDLQTDAELATLTEWLASTTTRLSLYHDSYDPEDMDRDRYDRYLSELHVFWEAVRGFDHGVDDHASAD